MAMFNIPKPLKPRGIRFSMPSGYVLGRVSSGEGDAELIPIPQLSQEQVKSGIIAPGPIISGSDPASLGFTILGKFGLSQQTIGAASHQNVAYPSGAGGDTAKVLGTVASIVDHVLYLVTDLPTFVSSGPPNGALATITFARGATTGTVSWYSATPTTVLAGTVPYIVAGSDYTLVDPFIDTVQIIFNGDIV